jgi:hypothetical protein
MAGTVATDWTAIAVALIAMVTAIASPFALAWQVNRNAAKVRAADWARQDAVAAKAEDVARRLLAANERVAEDAKTVSGKLDVIHELVNSSMTAAMQGEHDAMVRELAMMREVIALKEANGHAPGVEALATIEATETRIAELSAALADRLQQGEGGRG